MRPAPAAPAALGTHGPPGSQRGAALIALVLALALGSGLVTIEWLEAAARSSHAARRTEAALAAARDALIGYAASYPDQHSGRHGPGYLPCPDTSGNGSPNTPCARKSLGRLPWRRLGLHDPRDGAGERLWYALADNFRANGYKHRPLNRETAAGLVLDGRTEVAAVIVAPGPPLPFQDRARDRFDPAQYLEGGNETPHDATYTTRGSPPGPPAPPGATFDRFNDRVVAISRDDLMAAAGRRVLAEVRALLREYRSAPWNTGMLPWLAPWNGAAEGVLPVPGTIAGRLSLAPIGAALTTSFRVTGAPAGGSVSASGTVDAAVLRALAGAPPVPAGQCTWTAVSRVDCTGESRVSLGPDRERVFRFDLHLVGDATVAPPAPADVRRRGVRGGEWAADSYIEVLDLAGGAETGRGRIEFAAGPIQGSLAVEGVAYPFGVGGEAPEWLIENQWHRFLMAAFAPAFTAGGTAACGAPGRCLELVRTHFDGRTHESGAIAVVVLAGPELSHQQRASPGLVQWFEGENANPANLRYETRHSSQSFNDRAAALAPPPGASAP